MTECECPNIYEKVDFPAEKLIKKTTNAKKFICNEFIYGGHWLSLGGSAFILSIMLMLQISFRWELVIIVYLLLQIVYNYDHYTFLEEDSKNNPNRTNHLKKYQKFFPIFLVIYSSLFFGLLYIFGNTISFIFGTFLLTLGLLYTIFCKKLTSKIVGFKNFYTSFSVSLLVIFVTFHSFYEINILSLIFILFIFIRLLVNTSFCDLKDMDIDKKQNLKTLPIYFGKQKFLTFLHILNFISFILLSTAIVTGIAPSFSIFLLLFFPYVYYYIKKAKKTDTDLQSLSSFAVDGEFIIWPILLFIGSIFIF